MCAYMLAVCLWICVFLAIIMTPTRELAMQIGRECRKFTKALDLHVVCVYGGTGISEQIAELKRGAEVIVCTPGRMIDMLAANSGMLDSLCPSVRSNITDVLAAVSHFMLHQNKKFELMLTRCTKAYSSSCSQTVGLSPAISSQFILEMCAAAKDRNNQ